MVKKTVRNICIVGLAAVLMAGCGEAGSSGSSASSAGQESAETETAENAASSAEAESSAGSDASASENTADTEEGKDDSDTASSVQDLEENLTTQPEQVIADDDYVKITVHYTWVGSYTVDDSSVPHYIYELNMSVENKSDESISGIRWKNLSLNGTDYDVEGSHGGSMIFSEIPAGSSADDIYIHFPLPGLELCRITDITDMEGTIEVLGDGDYGSEPVLDSASAVFYPHGEENKKEDVFSPSENDLLLFDDELMKVYCLGAFREENLLYTAFYVDKGTGEDESDCYLGINDLAADDITVLGASSYADNDDNYDEQNLYALHGYGFHVIAAGTENDSDLSSAQKATMTVGEYNDGSLSGTANVTCTFTSDGFTLSSESSGSSGSSGSSESSGSSDGNNQSKVELSSYLGMSQADIEALGAEPLELDKTYTLSGSGQPDMLFFEIEDGICTSVTVCRATEDGSEETNYTLNGICRGQTLEEAEAMFGIPFELYGEDSERMGFTTYKAEAEDSGLSYNVTIQVKSNEDEPHVIDEITLETK